MYENIHVNIYYYKLFIFKIIKQNYINKEFYKNLILRMKL